MYSGKVFFLSSYNPALQKTKTAEGVQRLQDSAHGKHKAVSVPRKGAVWDRLAFVGRTSLLSCA